MYPLLSDPALFRRHALILLVAGLLVQGWLVTRQGILPDQNAVLYSGTQFLASDDLPAFAKPSSSGAQLPGFLLPALVGGAFSIWHDYRSPTLLAMALHAISFVLLAWVVSRELEPPWSLVYLTLYWLSVWRLFHAASVWEPSFVFLPAALHLWLCSRLQERPKFAESAWLAFLMVVSFQIHASAVLLVLTAVVLWMTRQIKVHYAGVCSGFAVALLLFIPTMSAMLTSGTTPALPQTHQGLPGGLLSLVKGATFWVRMSTPDLGERLSQAASFPRESAHGWLSAARWVLMVFVFPSAWATWRLIRPARKEAMHPARSWLGSYALASLVSLLAACLVSPASVQTWHTLMAFPAALIPMVLLLREHSNARSYSFWSRVLLTSTVGASLAVTVVLGLWHEQYQPPTSESLRRLNAPDEVRALVHHPH